MLSQNTRTKVTYKEKVLALQLMVLEDKVEFRTSWQKAGQQADRRGALVVAESLHHDP